MSKSELLYILIFLESLPGAIMLRKVKDYCKEHGLDFVENEHNIYIKHKILLVVDKIMIIDDGFNEFNIEWFTESSGHESNLFKLVDILHTYSLNGTTPVLYCGLSVLFYFTEYNYQLHELPNYFVDRKFIHSNNIIEQSCLDISHLKHFNDLFVIIDREDIDWTHLYCRKRIILKKFMEESVADSYYAAAYNYTINTPEYSVVASVSSVWISEKVFQIKEDDNDLYSSLLQIFRENCAKLLKPEKRLGYSTKSAIK